VKNSELGVANKLETVEVRIVVKAVSSEVCTAENPHGRSQPLSIRRELLLTIHDTSTFLYP
jgi:hypothetical protein